MRHLDELWVPAIVVIFGATYYAVTRGLPELSIAFPRFLMVLIALLAIVIVATELRRSHRRDSSGAAARPLPQRVADLRNPALVFGTAVIYLALFVASNFVVATIVYLAGTMMVLRLRWSRAVVIAVAFTLGLYGVFGYLFEVQI